MTRAEALEQFKERHRQETETRKEEFLTGLETGMEELMERIFTAFGTIADLAEEQEKVGCVYFLFSLLRYDLMQNVACVRLDVMNGGWFMDSEPLYTELDMTFLFQPYFQWREKLLLDMREYRGKVNKYDVEDMVQTEIMEANQKLMHHLRFAFRDMESQESFARIPKMAFWNIRFGEYRDYGEIVMQINREPRSMAEWLDKLELYEENPEVMQCSCWYRLEITKGDCRGKAMPFIVFEECTLKGMDFGEAQLYGARFLNCRLEKCSFAGANLEQTEWEGCCFADCSFAGADLKGAVFSPEDLEAEWFDEKQQEEMLIAAEMERGFS